MSTRVLTTHIPLPLAEKVDAMARRIDRPRGWIMKQALVAWVDQDEERHQMTLDALADVDAGLVIDQNEVTAWADSLTHSVPLQPPGE